MADNNEISYEARVKAAKEAGVPEIYFNGFVNVLGAGDIQTVIEKNGSPVAIINMSYTVAKTFAIALGSIIAQLEEKTGRDMLTTHDLEQVFKQKGN